MTTVEILNLETDVTTVEPATGAERLRGPELLRAAVNHILDHPETWNQRDWHCGTTHCVAGHCQMLAGLKVDPDTCYDDVRRLLGLSHSDADWLFSASRTLTEIHGFAKAYLEDDRDEAGFDRDGFDRAGYDRAGYDRAGYDRDGYDRAGFNRAGYDRAGFNRAGFNWAGSKLEKL